MHVAGIDPGRSKCGVALLDSNGVLIDRRVIDRDDVVRVLQKWTGKYNPLTIAIGDRTGSKEIMDELKDAEWERVPGPIVFVDEHLSTIEARQLYFEENPPKGLRKLLPLSMQVPPVAYDDYTAIVIARRFLKEKETK